MENLHSVYIIIIFLDELFINSTLCKEDPYHVIMHVHKIIIMLYAGMFYDNVYTVLLNGVFLLAYFQNI